MTRLFLHDRELSTVFSLLGNKENDITYSVGWGLAQCAPFLTALMRSVFRGGDPGTQPTVRLQQHGEDGGYTDIEIDAERFHLIIEAKRGWNLPEAKQLERYRSRLNRRNGKNALVVLSECTSAYAKERLPTMIRNVPVFHRSWKEVRAMAHASAGRGSHAEKRLLKQLSRYLETLMSMQNQISNEVYVVVLSPQLPAWSHISWLDFAIKRRVYFHPIAAGWPKEPPNYMGFRYGGFLRSIHHVDRYEIVDDVSRRVRNISGPKWRKERWSGGRPFINYFIYHLGPAIRPQREVRNGPIYATGRVKAALDLLLTCDTIAEAVRKTKERPQE